MTVEQLIQNPPKPQQLGNGEFVTMGINPAALRFIDQHVTPDFATLETGAGLSTSLFAVKGSRHTCVVPFAVEVQQIKEYAAANRISLEKTNFVIKPSERALPFLEPDALDLVLIDGRHAMPAPFIDWYYTAGRLKVGGWLMLDNTEIYPVGLLREFLCEMPQWKFVADLANTAVFQKLAAGSEDLDWGDQPWVAQRSRQRWPRVRHALRLLKEGKVLQVIGKTFVSLLRGPRRAEH